jgi:hypothetical protein
MALNPDDFKGILSLIGADLPSDLNPEDFKDFGKMTSHIYRAKFYAAVKDLVDAGSIQYASVSVIIYFATLIKNKKRILDALVRLYDKYGTTTWLKDAVFFYENATVQYVSEAERTGLFPVVNLPSCQPNLAAHYFKLHLKKDKVARSDVDLMKKFMENLWFCQLRVTPDLKAKHKTWEVNFWNSTVKKSKNPDSGRYERGFNETYYQTKSEDDYKFIVGGKEVETTYDEAALLVWLKA